MTMKIEMNDSEYSNDSQSSQGSSTNDGHLPIPHSRPTLLLASLDGLNSGVPTRTTATITPTQLRNFEQTYIDLNSSRADQNNHAGFVPPAINNCNNYGVTMLNQSGYCEQGPATALHVSPGPFSTSGESSSPGLPAPKRRNMGGRRPAKVPQDLSPEEEERRKVRRERNKMAAARCRKRRLDHTNELQDETDKLEAKRQSLQEEIKKLNRECEDLTVILNRHLPSCRAPSSVVNKRSVSPPELKPFPHHDPFAIRIKDEALDPDDADHLHILENDIYPPLADNRIMLSAASMSLITNTPVTAVTSLETPPVTRPNRPNFLEVAPPLNPAQLHNSKAGNKIAGVEITTPSNGIPFNFESIMDGGTGLTPVQPHPQLICAIQQRQAPDITSPDAHNSLVSL